MCETATESLSGDDSISTAIVNAIAAVEGVDPIDLDLCLGNYLDTDALNQLYANHPERERVPSFSVSFEEYEVQIDSYRTVTVSQVCDDAETCEPVEVTNE
jgi:hypothetical protein